MILCIVNFISEACNEHMASNFKIVVEKGAPGWAAMVKKSDSSKPQPQAAPKPVIEAAVAPAEVIETSVEQLPTKKPNSIMSRYMKGGSGLKPTTNTNSKSRLLRQCQGCGMLFSSFHNCEMTSSSPAGTSAMTMVVRSSA